MGNCCGRGKYVVDPENIPYSVPETPTSPTFPPEIFQPEEEVDKVESPTETFSAPPPAVSKKEPLFPFVTISQPLFTPHTDIALSQLHNRRIFSDKNAPYGDAAKEDAKENDEKAAEERPDPKQWVVDPAKPAVVSDPLTEKEKEDRRAKARIQEKKREAERYLEMMADNDEGEPLKLHREPRAQDLTGEVVKPDADSKRRKPNVPPEVLKEFVDEIMSISLKIVKEDYPHFVPTSRAVSS